MLILDPYGRSGVFIGTASTKYDGLQDTQTPSTESHAVKLPHPFYRTIPCISYPFLSFLKLKAP